MCPRSIDIRSLLKASGAMANGSRGRAESACPRSSRKHTEKRPLEPALPHGVRRDVAVVVSKKAVDVKIGFGRDWIFAANGWFFNKMPHSNRSVKSCYLKGSLCDLGGWLAQTGQSVAAHLSPSADKPGLVGAGASRRCCPRTAYVIGKCIIGSRCELRVVGWETRGRRPPRAGAWESSV